MSKNRLLFLILILVASGALVLIIKLLTLVMHYNNFIIVAVALFLLLLPRLASSYYTISLGLITHHGRRILTGLCALGLAGYDVIFDIIALRFFIR